jgi:replicative DNA helicase
MANPEQLLISAIVRTGNHLTPASSGITSKFFHAFDEEYKWIERYISKHKRAPSRAAFQSTFPKFSLKKADDVAFFCEEVRKSHVQARLTAAIQDVIGDIEDGHLDTAIRTLHHQTLDIESQMAGISGDADIIEHWEPTHAEVMRRMARQKQFGQAGLPTGFPTLDERTGGPQGGQVWVIAARLGQGKTWSLVRMAAAACFSGFNIQYDALEQSRAEIAMRVHTFASSEYGKEVFRNLDLAQGRNFSPRSYKEFLQGLKGHVKGKFHVADTSSGGISPLTIAAQIERNRPHGLYLDYITLMDTEEDGWQGVSKLSKALHNMAQLYEIPIIAAAQLNRNAAAGKELSGPENLAEADAIGRDADAVVTMRQLSKRVIAMKLAKYRHGPDGYTWYTKFLPNTGHFEEVTLDEALDIQAEDKDDDDGGEVATFKPRKKGSYSEHAKKRTVIDNAGVKVVNGKVIRTKPKIEAPKRKVVVKKK